MSKIILTRNKTIVAPSGQAARPQENKPQGINSQTLAKIQLRTVQRAIERLDPKRKNFIEVVADRLRAVLRDHDFSMDTPEADRACLSNIAFALVGAEIAATPVAEPETETPTKES